MSLAYSINVKNDIRLNQYNVSFHYMSDINTWLILWFDGI